MAVPLAPQAGAPLPSGDRPRAGVGQIKTRALQDAIVKSASFSSIATDERGVIQIFNVGAERMSGYAAADVVNRITPADISDPQELIARASALSDEFDTSITPGFDALVFKASRGIEDIYELTYLRKDGSRVPAIVSVTSLRDADDEIIGYLLIGTDNTARRQVEQTQALLEQQLRDQQNLVARTADLQHLAGFDALTGLPNRVRFHETLARSLGLAARNGWSVAVLFLDLDQFKNVNDTLGHAIGDLLLKQVGERLVGCARISDTVGRQGGDEFALILLLEAGRRGAAAVVTKMHDVLRAPFDVGGHEVSITASTGITLYPDDADDADTLMKYADTAMYWAKRAGRDRFCFFTAEMNAEVLAELELETALRAAVKNEEFVLHYQPKVELSSGRIVGLEALLRWERPGHGLLSPGTFIQTLESTGLIVRVGSWVISQACRQLAAWSAAGLDALCVSVNVAGRQFIEGDLEADVRRALDEHRVPPSALELELTESSLMENTERTIQTLHSLRRLGLAISVDDFGTGYSSLAYLRRFPIDKLKIDEAFVRDITSEPDEAAIALAIIQMAHSLKLDVIAEGVETAAQLAYLRHHRCDQVQGYYFSRPLPAVEIEQMMRAVLAVPRLEEASAPCDVLLLVDGDADHLRALCAAFEPERYRVLCASDAAAAFELLALHPVQVVLCGATLPDLGGLMFLERVKDLHPQALRVLVSGDLDVDVLQTAVNRGSLHRCWSSPWDSQLLRADMRDVFRQWRTSTEVAQPDTNDGWSIPAPRPASPALRSIHQEPRQENEIRRGEVSDLRRTWEASSG